jgi:hypothetical protein
VVEQDPVTQFDGIPEKVARLEVAYPVPMFSHIRPILEIIKGKTARFGFEKPECHRFT